MKTMAILLLSGALLLPMIVAAEEARPASLLVLDASGSMWAQVGGRTRIEIAREAAGAMLDNWDAHSDLGLMAYGHRRKGDCADIELLQPVGAFEAEAIRAHIAALQPKGMTPIAESVRQAAAALRHAERKATVILVSDGEETCSADPCAVGAELEASGVDFTAHVIGFDLENNPKAREQLQCLARATGGRYLDARDAGELSDAMKEVAAAGEAGVDAAPAETPAIRFNEGCTAYDQENYAGEQMQMGGESGLRVREVPTRWRTGIKSLSCQQGCGILVFTEPGYDGGNFSIPDGSQFTRMPEDYQQPFGSYEVGCSAIFGEQQ